METKPNPSIKNMKVSWIPNILTGIRLLFAFLFPLLNSSYWIFFLTLALLTEFLDGAMARRFHWATASGQILDPIADRLFALSVGLTLVFAQRILPIQLLFIMVRDIVVSLGLFAALFKLNTSSIITIFKPNFVGKATTGLQYLFYYDVLLFTTPHKELLWTVGLTSLASAVLYVINFFLHNRIARDKNDSYFPK